MEGGKKNEASKYLMALMTVVRGHVSWTMVPLLPSAQLSSGKTSAREEMQGKKGSYSFGIGM